MLCLQLLLYSLKLKNKTFVLNHRCKSFILRAFLTAVTTIHDRKKKMLYICLPCTLLLPFSLTNDLQTTVFGLQIYPSLTIVKRSICISTVLSYMGVIKAIYPPFYHKWKSKYTPLLQKQWSHSYSQDLQDCILQTAYRKNFWLN